MEKIKVTGIKTFLVGTERRDLLFIKIETNVGICGFGEGSIEGKSSIVEQLITKLYKNYLLGENPLNIEKIYFLMYRNEYWQGGALMMTALSAIEMALWDITGKYLGQPVWQLLGGKVRDKVKAYANGWYRGAKKPQEYYEKAKKVVEKGYRALKFDPFGTAGKEISSSERHRAIEIIDAVYEAVGKEVDVLIEGHGRFSTQTAVEVGKILERYNPYCFEEPVSYENIDALERVYNKLNIPIATGERLYGRFGFRELLKRGCVAIIQPDICHTGGIFETKKIAAIAETEYISVAPHNPYGPICTSACLQIAGCTTNFAVQESFQDFEYSYLRNVVSWCPEVIDGYYEIPNRPGLGMEINEEVVSEFPPKDKEFCLWDRKNVY